MFFIYHVSVLLQFLTEHAWNIAGEPVADWNDYASRCWGAFVERGSRYSHPKAIGAAGLHMSFAWQDGWPGCCCFIYRYGSLAWSRISRHMIGIIWRIWRDRTQETGNVVCICVKRRSMAEIKQALRYASYGVCVA
ncbi:hypothetical protein WJ64_20260 [Burkholderia ubonensis]|nr:hypothetical protein WJ64_20260 [Burkholderia ubonensis]